jgi:HAD superfamily phosphatase
VKLAPKLVIFDMDGVLIDVHGSFHKSIVDTIHFFTGRRVTYGEIHEWKNRSGYNDDWRLTTDWIASLGEAVPYAVVKKQFQKFYWGTKARPGNVSRERWLVTHARLARWSRRAELALFTGRTRRELRHTLDNTDAKSIFRRAVTMDDVTKGKPHPEGLRLLLDGTSPREALYLGDNIDDALAAKRARVPFLGVLPHGSDANRFRAAKLRELGALAILHSVRDLEKLWR